MQVRSDRQEGPDVLLEGASLSGRNEHVFRRAILALTHF
jgi:hypothetical protein